MDNPRTARWMALALTMGSAPLAAQGRMMGGGDSTSAAVMQVVHQLLVNHEKLRRTVVNLPNGVRTLTESDDPAMAEQLKRHVAMTGTFVEAGRDPNLPMSTPALHGVLQNGRKISRSVEVTAKGVLVVETSGDSATVALLQRHAAEITDQVNRGMAAIHSPAPVTVSEAAPTAMTHQAGMVHDAGMVHEAGMSHEPASGVGRPTRAGQEAFATMGEIVRLLDADPATDWSKVDLESLREHLRDMDDVTLRAEVRATSVDGGAIFDVQGTGRVREAIRRMALAHGGTITPADGFRWTAVETPTGARVTIVALKADDRAMAARIRALGFVAMLTLGDHHTAHHLGLANGTMRGTNHKH
jgi:hypothetical protein